MPRPIRDLTRGIGRRAVLLSIMALGLSAPAAGEDVSNPVYLDVTATTPGRLDIPARESTISLTILTEPEIASRNPVTFPEAVRDLPGVRLEESGTMGESAKLSLRGAEPTQTLVLLDGIPINSPFDGDTDLGGLIVDEVGQIEVVRGAQSALYGSDAIGGVVNFRMRKAERPLELEAALEAGTDRTFRERLSAGGKGAWSDFRFTVSRTDTEGQLDRDAFEATSLAGRAGFSLPGRSRLEILSRFQESHKELELDVVDPGFSEACQTRPDVDPGNCVEVAADENREIDQAVMFGLLRYEVDILPWWNMSVSGSGVKLDKEEDNPSEPDSGFPAWSFFEDTETTQTTLNLQHNMTWLDRQVFTLGLEYEAEAVDSRISIPDLEEILGAPFDPIEETRANAAVYAQQLVRTADSFALQAGVRMDRNSQFGSEWNPKVSSAYRWSPTGTRIRGSWGAGFRAPSLEDLYFPVLGNENLDPERSRSWEAGLGQSLFGGDLSLDVVYFRIDFEDLIQRSPTGVDNIGKARTQGIESSLEIRAVSFLVLSGNYTYLSAQDMDTDSRLPFRPRHQGNIRVEFTPSVRIIAALDIHLVSSQAIPVDFILDDGTVLRNDSPGYAVTNFSANYHLFGNYWGIREVKIFGKVTNLLDRDYQSVPGFPGPGIAFLGGIQMTL